MKMFTKIMNIILVSCMISFVSMTNRTMIGCGDIICDKNNGRCVESDGVFECLCSKEFDSFPENNIHKCQYKRKSKIMALLLELFFTYGAGHFYAENYRFAIPKFLFFTFAYYGFILLRAINKGNQGNKKLLKAIKISAIIVLVFMLVWQITDIVLFGLNYITDGHGREML